MKKKLLHAITLVLAASTIMAFTACGSTTTSSSDSDVSTESKTQATTLLDSIKEKGELTIGTASGYPPYEFVDIESADQSITGIDIALAQCIADELGVKLNVVDMSFDGLLSSLTTGKVDIAIAGINPTDERKKTVDFSDVYLAAEQKLLINKDRADELKTIADFYGKQIGAEKGTSQEAVAQAEITDATMVSLGKVPDLILELKNNKIDGIVIESIVAQQYILSDDSLTFSDAAFKNKEKNSGIAVPKGNEDLLEIINKVIADKKASGDFDKWTTKYSELVLEQSK